MIGFKRLEEPFVLGMIVRVQQFVRFMSQGFMQEIFIDLLDFCVFMRFTYRHGFIFDIDGIQAFDALDIGLGYRLAPTAYAAARAGHNLDKVVGRFTRPHLVH